jgi:hypothetical protein
MFSLFSWSQEVATGSSLLRGAEKEVEATGVTKTCPGGSSLLSWEPCTHLDLAVQQPCALDDLFCGHLEHLLPDSILLFKEKFMCLLYLLLSRQSPTRSLSFPTHKFRMKSAPLPISQAARSQGPGHTVTSEPLPPLPTRASSPWP